MTDINEPQLTLQGILQDRIQDRIQMLDQLQPQEAKEQDKEEIKPWWLELNNKGRQDKKPKRNNKKYDLF